MAKPTLPRVADAFVTAEKLIEVVDPANGQAGMASLTQIGVGVAADPDVVVVLALADRVDGETVAWDEGTGEWVSTVTSPTTAEVAAAGAVMESDTSTAAMQFVIDEDSFGSNLNTKVPTQQSVLALVTARTSRVVNPQTGTTYEYAATDVGNLVGRSNASAMTDTLPLNATTPIDNGSEIPVLNSGPGSITFEGAVGVTVTPQLGKTLVLPSGGFASLLKRTANLWYVAGDLVESNPTLHTVAGGAAVENIGAVEWNINVVAATGSTETLDTSLYGVHKCTMDQNCTFTFSNPAPSGKETEFKLYLYGAFTPTWPAAVDWADATPPTYSAPSIYVFSTIDAGTTWFGSLVGKAFG